MNILKCSDNNINKFSFMSRKGVYTQENMDEGENFNETSLSKKENYSNLDMEDITNSDHNHVK